MITGDFKGGKGAGKTPRKGSCCLNKGGQDTGPVQGCLLRGAGCGGAAVEGCSQGESTGDAGAASAGKAAG